MAIEEMRGCGYRKVDKMYIIGGLISRPCDRLPLEIGACPVCGEGVRVTRGFTKIIPFKLWSNHIDTYVPIGLCKCESLSQISNCVVCFPPDDTAYLLGVGEKYYTPEEFVNEARMMGVSKAISALPRDLKIGETVVYITHPKGIEVHSKVHSEEFPGITHKPAVICAFIPRYIEKLVWDNATQEELDALEKRGITPVKVPVGDTDHDPVTNVKGKPKKEK